MPIRSARQAFLVHPAKLKFKELAETVVFDVACEHALLVFVEEELPGANEPVEGLARHAQLDGARRVLRILRELHIEPKAPEKQKDRQLRIPS